MKLIMKAVGINREEFVRKIKSGDFEFTDDPTYDCFLLSNFACSKLMVKDNDGYISVDVDSISYFESYGNTVYSVIDGKKYKTVHKLYELEFMFKNYNFIRISKSVIINRKMIKKVLPSLNTKFRLVMLDDTSLIVTRSYYYNFKEEINI